MGGTDLCNDRIDHLHWLIRLLPATFLCLLLGSCSDIKRTETEQGVLLQPLPGGDLGIRFARDLPCAEFP